jgi:hypothetical protein
LEWNDEHDAEKAWPGLDPGWIRFSDKIVLEPYRRTRRRFADKSSHSRMTLLQPLG